VPSGLFNAAAHGAYAAQFMAQIKNSLESWDEQAFGL